MNNYDNVNDLTLDQLEPFIEGREFTSKPCKQVRLNTDTFNKFMQMIEEDYNAKRFLESFEFPKDFYNTLPDFKHFFPAEVREELFYAAKNGKMYVEIPSACVYLLNKAWDQCNGIPNLLLKTVPLPALSAWLRKGYFLGAVTLKDAICNVCTPMYKPLCNTRLRNRVNDFTEIYIGATDMVAAVPNAIADALDDDSIRRITVTPSGLAVDGVLLRTMANYVGAINSIYDLRELL